MCDETKTNQKTLFHFLLNSSTTVSTALLNATTSPPSFRSTSRAALIAVLCDSGGEGVPHSIFTSRKVVSLESPSDVFETSKKETRTLGLFGGLGEAPLLSSLALVLVDEEELLLAPAVDADEPLSFCFGSSSSSPPRPLSEEEEDAAAEASASGTTCTDTLKERS